MPDFNLATWLEWQSYLLVLTSVLLYGRSKWWGSFLGIVGSVSFMVYGWHQDIVAAIVTSVIYVVLHARNLWIANHE